MGRIGLGLDEIHCVRVSQVTGKERRLKVQIREEKEIPGRQF